MKAILEKIPALSRKKKVRPALKENVSSEPNYPEQIKSLEENITSLKKELAESHAQIGLLEAQKHSYWYTCLRFKHRIQSLCEELWGAPQTPPNPPKWEELSEEVKNEFTLNGKIGLEHNYFVGVRPQNYPLIYTEDEIASYNEMIDKREWFLYGMTDHWLWDAFEKHSIKDKTIAIMGSLSAWYETTCLRYGGQPYTIEYNKIISKTPRIHTMSVAEYEANPIQFDVGLSISSFEHDGLGAYGDPVDPHGDLKAMQKMKKMIKPNGLLFFTAPIGRDRVRWNECRIYGKVRLPLLFEGWEQIDAFGMNDEQLEREGAIQPIFVLRNLP